MQIYPYLTTRLALCVHSTTIRKTFICKLRWLRINTTTHLLTQFLLFQDVEHLKPHIVRSLANAEFYCMALSVLYADPNFHNLNHWGIIQALARKGICVAEPSDCSLTETVLIQTTPLKMVSLFASEMRRQIFPWYVGITILDLFGFNLFWLISKCRNKVCNCVR